ncbi:hypothetical protein RhiirA5_412507 [Rhizophagus irregularis]|uniref:TRP C-terminal domain-containing protein n=1 Tax=Rhizophagus irregularis TaxID=588596 RepID=A0A2I1DUC1_9GLOM|nr:hypothetical protein RhiirA5_412507 [Rhizophagus irregularis]GBC38767.2 DUF907 domain protein [Rhizophagus irregularis DAOM 181602=DAOM 197198]PKY13481.1 hypothetical protein RhiirB3_425305 [Rhizophagus irregularis]UZO18823.1 hypothetical protein OCT59_010131 [Rhizophagus irregularis]CAB5163702.1 unnamed protein product [Rhizophagus irregularis]
MRNIRPFELVLFAIILLVFQVDQTLSSVPLVVNDNFDNFVTFTGRDVFTAFKLASKIEYSWEFVEGDASALSLFVLDEKTLKEHPECFVVENCKVFPYPEASCISGGCGNGAKSLNSNLPKQRLMLAIVKANFDSSLKLKIKITFDPPDTPKPEVSGTPKPDTSHPPLLTPTVTPHPGNLLTGDITPDGYANCGSIKFNDFRVLYSKEQNNIELYLEGNGENIQSQAKIFVYFDAEHIVYKKFPIQFNGLFTYKDKFSTNFDDRIPDSFFNVPGTGSYAILTLQDADQGCVTAPIGSQSTAYSNGITGISMTIALAFILLSASLLFLRRDVNYSIYPKKWWSIGEGITDISRTTDDNINRNIPSLIPISATATASYNSSLTQIPSIYDLISVAQWIVTIALLTLPNLPVGYRQFASNFGWSTGTGGGINVQAFSNAASNLRKLVCPLSPVVCTSSLNQFDTCQPWFNSDVTPEHLFTASITNGDKTYFPDPTGFESYSNALHIPNSNIFFVMFVALLLAIGAALIIMLLIGAIAFMMKEKVKIFEKVNKNMRFLVFVVAVGLLPFCIYKVLSTFKTDADLLWNEKYKILFGVLYTDYLKDRVWFVILIMVYQFLRSLIVAIGHHSGIAQLTCLVILEFAYLITVYYFKPFERNLANIFNITLSAGRLIVLFLLIPFLGGDITITPTTRFSLAIVLIIIQLLMAVCVGGLILLNILCAAFKFLFKKNAKTDESADLNQTQEAGDDNNLSIKEKIDD